LIVLDHSCRFEEMEKLNRSIVVVFVVSLSAISLFAQGKKTPRPAKPSPSPSVESTPLPAQTPPKKNVRPTDGAVNSSVTEEAYKPAYFYEFTRPGFITFHILIDHDEKGKGKISYEKENVGGVMTDSFQLTDTTMKGINDALERLNFLDSTENYQYPKDFSNMGNVVFRFVKGGRERTVKVNWTINKDARFLMDEYRRIGIEVQWKAEIGMSRENQPLESPRLLDALDSYLRLGEISDPRHLIPLLNELSNDERLPLITRNHATRLSQRIEKTAK